MAIPRLTRHDPPPTEVQFAEMLERARWNRRVRRAATYWHLTPPQIKRLLFTDWLIEAGRIGKGDRV